MYMADIISQLRKVVPGITDLFTRSNDCTITSAANVATVTTATDHNLNQGDVFSISGALTPYKVVSLVRTGNVVRGTTAEDHDLTEGWQESISISGASPAEYNGIKELTRVPNRRSFEYTIDDSVSSPATGSDITMVDPLSSAYTGEHTVASVVSPTEFTYAVQGNPDSPALGSPKLQTEARISGAVTQERMTEAYTKQAPNEFWLMVVAGDTLTSRNRAIETDAIETLTAADLMKVRQVETVAVYCLCPAADEIAARSVRDQIEAEVKPALLSALLGYTPESVYFDNNWCMLIPSGDGFADYTTATYVHRFEFERSIDLLKEDGISISPTKAWRDTQIQYLNEHNETIMQSDIDMDDEPL